MGFQKRGHSRSISRKLLPPSILKFYHAVRPIARVQTTGLAFISVRAVVPEGLSLQSLIPVSAGCLSILSFILNVNQVIVLVDGACKAVAGRARSDPADLRNPHQTNTACRVTWHRPILTFQNCRRHLRSCGMSPLLQVSVPILLQSGVLVHVPGAPFGSW